MTSVMALDGVTLFLHLKGVTNTCKPMRLFAEFLQCNGGKLEEAEDFKSVFDIYSVLNRNRSALMCESSL